MPAPNDAYSEGYAKGKNSTPGDALAEMTMGMLRDDPGGHFAAGYRDGAAGKTFNPFSENARRADAELNPFDDRVAIKTVCPNCGEMDWFEWKFMGRLTDPVCGHSWYAGSGTYALMQLRAAFKFGGRFGKYMTFAKSKSRSPGEELVGSLIKGMFWILGALIGIGIRLECAVLMIPIQAIAGLFHSKNTRSDIAARVAAIVVVVAGLGLGLYEMKHASKPQFQASQSARFTQQGVTSGSVALYRPATTSSQVPRPSFNCSNARTPTEKLICRDADLAVMESAMATAYRRALQRQPADQTAAFRHGHLTWFKQYARDCDSQPTDTTRKECVTRYLTAHTQQIQQPSP